MLKKALICLGCVALGVLLLILLVFYRGKDGVTFFQKQNIDRYMSVNAFEQDAGGNNILMPIATASGTDGYETDTFLGAKNQMDYRTGYIEVKVAVNAANEVVLADSFASIKAEPVKFSRVIKELKTYGDNGLVVKLSEYKQLSAVNSVLLNYGVLTKSVITGVNENAVKYVKSYFPQVRVLCDYTRDSERSLESIKADGADGIICSADVFGKSLLDRAKKLDLLVWVDCEDDAYVTVQAMSFGADGIVTSVPDFALTIGMNWSKGVFESYFDRN